MLLYQRQHIVMPNGRKHAVIGTDPTADGACIIDLESPTALPAKHSYAWLCTNTTVVDSTVSELALAVASKYASPAQIEVRDSAWALIETLAKNPMVLESESRWKLISERARELKRSPATILRYLRRFWQGGQTEDALLGRYNNSGKVKEGCVGGRGRPTSKPGHKKYVASQVDFKNFESVIRGFYLKEESKFHSIPDTVQHLYEQHYCYTDGNGKRFVLGEGEKPTQKQFEYYLRKNFSREVRIRGRHGDKEFERNHRPVLGTIAEACRGVGHIYEIDATIADQSLVSKWNRADLIGRPVVYYIVDRKSTLIVGYYVGLENASWSAALQAIFSIVDDKAALCKRLNLPYDPEDWPAHGILGLELYLDRGEGIGRESTKLCSGTQTTVTNLPSLRPDWKPLVEGSFAWMHRAICVQVPGYNAASVAGMRRTKDHGLDATLTLDEFEAIVVHNIIMRNRQIRAGHQMTTAQISARVEPSPINIWNHDVVANAGYLSRYSADALRLKLLPGATATVDDHGIFVNGCFYRPESVDRRSWFVEGVRRVMPVEVTFDMRRVDKIYVHDEKEPGGFFIAALTTRSDRYAGLSVDEVAYLQYVEAGLKAPARLSKAQTLMEAHDHARPVLKKAKQKTEAAMAGKRRSGRRDNVVQARDDARNDERDARAVPASRAGAPVQQSAPEPATNNVVSLRAGKQEPVPTAEGTAAAAAPLSTAAERARRLREQMMNG